MKNQMPTVWALLVSYLFIHGFTAEPANNDRYKVIRVIPRNKEQLILLQDIIHSGKEIDVWRAPAAMNSTVDLNLSPDSFDNIIPELETNGIYSEILIKDVQQAIYDQQKIVGRQISVNKDAKFNYGKYHTLKEIHNWVQKMATKYNTITTIFKITNSYEGRPLLGLKISSQSKIERKGFWLEGGIHGREWIAPATVIYMAGYTLDHYKTAPEMTSLLDMFNWYIVPVVNPDGYEYTWSQDEGAMAACEALRRVHRTKYEHGSIANIIYTTSGSSADWAYPKAGIKYLYGVELRDTGKYGFLLPADQIIPSGQESLKGIVALAKYI